VEVEGNAIRIAEFTDPNDQAGVYSFAAAVFHHQVDFNAKVVYMPYEFNFIMTPQDGGGIPPIPSAARTHVLEEVLLFFGHIGDSPHTDVPDPGVFAVKSYPNPFNPSTKIEYYMPRRGELTVKIYNIRGELVKTLVDEVCPAGVDFVVWDGTNNSSYTAASGVYFYQAKAMGETIVKKIALIK
jgi:hypothetical protein